MGLARMAARWLGGDKNPDNGTNGGVSGVKSLPKAKSPYRNQAVDPKEVGIAVERLREQGKISPETEALIIAEIDRVRHEANESTKAVSETGLTKEQSELLMNLEAQYPKMKASLERRKISTKSMPSWEQIKKGLTPEVLGLALKLEVPDLLLIPPTTRQSKVEAIDKYPAKCQMHNNTYTYEINNNDFWNGGISQSENKWRVSIVEGVQDVTQDIEIFNGKRTNYEMTKMWVEKYAKEGLDVMNDADAYLVLMMKRLEEGKPIDPNTYTVLNGKNLERSSLLAYGRWFANRVHLGDNVPTGVTPYLRLRGSVEVDVPMA